MKFVILLLQKATKNVTVWGYVVKAYPPQKGQ